MKSVKIASLKFGEDRPKIIIPLAEDNAVDIINCANFYRRQPGDMVEWRIDYFDDFDELEELAELSKRVKTSIQKPLLATFRTLSEGGESAIGKSQYVEMYRYLIQAKAVDAIDIEFERGQDILDNLIPFAHKHQVKVIVSYHDFVKTPLENDMVKRLQKMGQSEADIVKMAVMPHDEADVLALMNATHQASTLIDQPLITMSMGRLGKITRIAGEIFKSAASFATVEGMSSAPGQMDVEDVEECMNLLNLRVDDLDDDDF